MYKIYSLFSLLFVFISASVYIFIDTVVSNGDKTRWIFTYIVVVSLIVVLLVALLRVIYQYDKIISKAKLKELALTSECENVNGKIERLLEERNKMLGSIIEEFTVCLNSIKNSFFQSNICDKEIKRLELLLKRLGIYYRQEIGKEQIVLSLFSITGIMRELQSEYKEWIESRGNSFLMDSYGADVILADREKIKHICRELLSNAGQYTNNGKVSFVIEVNEETISLSVCDTGPGIDDASKHLIYRPFVRLFSSFSRGGLGLGLTIARNYVRLLGGDIRSLGNKAAGSCFIADIPIVGRSVTNDMRVLPNINVLLCENVPSNIGQLLTNLHISYDACCNFQEVEKKIRQKSYHLLITDSYVLDTCTIEKLEKLRNSSIDAKNSIPVILMSASNVIIQDDIRLADSCSCIYKPVNQADLYVEICKIVEKCAKQIYLPDFRPLLEQKSVDTKNDVLNEFISNTEQKINELRVACTSVDYYTMNCICDDLYTTWSKIHAETTILDLRKSLLNPTDEEYVRLTVQKVLNASKNLVELAKNLLAEPD